jgi:NADPH:quinone reductase-like Zn-dependent oxidoreductase
MKTTGGVSIFAIQFALAAGATVIATTSTEAKARKLKELGAHHVINYKENAKWGETAKSLTPGGIGVNHVIEVGGPATIAQALKSIQMDGVINIVGFLGGFKNEEEPSYLEALGAVAVVRGVMVGSRQQHEEMNKAIVVNEIRPVVDRKIFKLEEAREAYQYMVS